VLHFVNQNLQQKGIYCEKAENRLYFPEILENISGNMTGNCKIQHKNGT
jgi:hypothetical protein